MKKKQKKPKKRKKIKKKVSVNNNIKNVLDTMHVEDYILWEALQELEKNKTWPSNTLSSEEKEYLVNNVQNYKFFDDTMGRTNLCVIRKK